MHVILKMLEFAAAGLAAIIAFTIFKVVILKPLEKTYGNWASALACFAAVIVLLYLLATH